MQIQLCVRPENTKQNKIFCTLCTLDINMKMHLQKSENEIDGENNNHENSWCRQTAIISQE